MDDSQAYMLTWLSFKSLEKPLESPWATMLYSKLVIVQIQGSTLF